MFDLGTIGRRKKEKSVRDSHRRKIEKIVKKFGASSTILEIACIDGIDEVVRIVGRTQPQKHKPKVLTEIYSVYSVNKINVVPARSQKIIFNSGHSRWESYEGSKLTFLRNGAVAWKEADPNGSPTILEDYLGKPLLQSRSSIRKDLIKDII